MHKGVAIASGLGGLSLGAGLMYLLDPDRGNRRRALIRDQAAHLTHQAGDAMGARAKDVGNRARGVVAETTARLRPEEVTDERLVARVRSKMGRVVSHPRSIIVTAHQGRVTLSGPILAGEVGDLLATVAAVRGVTDVENRLDVREAAENWPAPQGEMVSTEEAARWPVAARVLAGTAGGALTAYGAKRRDTLGAALGTVGLGLLAGGLSRTPGMVLPRHGGTEITVTEIVIETPGSMEEGSPPAGECEVP